MNALTKAFVVLVTLLSVILVALFVPYVANQENYRGAVEELETRNALLQRQLSVAQSEIDAVANRKTQQIADLNNNIQNYVQQINDLTSEVQNLNDQLVAARSRNAQIEANVNRLVAANEQATEILESQQSELNELRQERQNSETRIIQAADRINDLQSQVDSLTTNLRRLRERLVELQTSNEDLETQLAKFPSDVKNRYLGTGAGAEEVEAVTAQQMIRGQITQVVPLESETLVKVNIGAADGVAENTKFLVHRGNEYLGTLVITRVDDQESAGRITLQQKQVQEGDEIFSGAAS